MRVCAREEARYERASRFNVTLLFRAPFYRDRRIRGNAAQSLECVISVPRPKQQY